MIAPRSSNINAERLIALVVLEEKLNEARNILDNLKTDEDYFKYGLNINRSEPSGIRGTMDTLIGGEETHTACINMKNFFDRFGVETEEVSHSRYLIKPRIKGVQVYENEPWYADLCLLLESGYCTPAKEYMHSIFEACGKLAVRVGYRYFFERDYIVICGEFDRYALKRYDCLAYFLEKARNELTEYSQNCSWKSPKPGMLKEWSAAAFRYERLRQMMNEIYHHHKDFEKIVKVYVGKIGGYGFDVTKTDDPHTFISHINFNPEFTSNSYSGLDDTVILNIDHALGIEWFVKHYYDEERHRRYDEGKSTTLRAYVDSINYIKRLEWVEE